MTCPQGTPRLAAVSIRYGKLPFSATYLCPSGGGGHRLTFSSASRPEAIESVWYMYRITGDPAWQEKGWNMWQSVISHVRTEIAASAINGVNIPDGATFIDKMESFWLAETLKYFYLLYSDPDVVSLDDWVLNTEAHPFRRPS